MQTVQNGQVKIILDIRAYPFCTAYPTLQVILRAAAEIISRVNLLPLPQIQFPIRTAVISTAPLRTFHHSISHFRCRSTQILQRKSNMHSLPSSYVHLNFFSRYPKKLPPLLYELQGASVSRGKRHIPCTKADGPSPVRLCPRRYILWQEKYNVTDTIIIN